MPLLGADHMATANLPSRADDAAPLRAILSRLDEPTGPLDRQQVQSLRGRLERAVDDATGGAILRAATRVSDPLMRSLLVALAAQYRIFNSYVMQFGALPLSGNSALLAPQDAAIIASLTSSIVKITDSCHKCLKSNIATRPFRARS